LAGRRKAKKKKAKATKAPTQKQWEHRHYIATVEDRYNLTYPITGLTPESYTSALRSADIGDTVQWMELLEQAEDRDAQIAQAMATRKHAVVSCDHSIRPWRDYTRREAREPALPEDVEVANFVRDALYGLPEFEDRLLDLLDAIYKGYAAVEINWKAGGQKLYAINELISVPQRVLTYYPQNDGQLRLITEDSPTEGEALKDRHWIVHAPHSRSVEPWKAGLGRILGWYFIFKHANLRNWLAFLETHAHPTRIGVYHKGMSQDSKQAIWNAIRRASTDQAALVEGIGEDGNESPIKYQWPETEESSASFLSLINYCDKEIVKCVLGQTLTSDVGDTGSYAAAQIHDKIRHTYLSADADALCTTIRRDLIAPLVEINFGADYLKRLPWFYIDYSLPEDHEKEARALGILSQQVGMSFSAKAIHEKFGTESPDGDDDRVAFRPSGTGDESDADIDVAEMKAGKRSEDDPVNTVVESLNMPMPPVLTSNVAQYANTVDAWMASATGNVTARVANYLKRHGEFASDEEFADEFMEWTSKGWGQYWAAGAMTAGLIGPYISAIYEHFKVGDTGAFPKGPPMEFTYGAADQRFVNFMNRADRFSFSKMLDHQSYRGAMKEFLIEEFGKNGGKLWGPQNAALIEKFKNAAGAKAHLLSRYEVDKIIKSTVSRGRNWARLGQFVDAGVEYGSIMNGGNPCQFCQDLSGEVVSIRKLTKWVDSAMELDDEGFAKLLQSRTDSHRAAVKAGTPAEHYIGSLGPPGYHASCECTIVYER